MKKCKECKSENLTRKSFGDGWECKCNDCGLIAMRVCVGHSGRVSAWKYYHRTEDETH